MTERERIVAYLRERADRHDATGDYEERLIGYGLREAAQAIENRVHLIRPEPTIPASEHMKKSNLGH